jgi:hypothetical protein
VTRRKLAIIGFAVFTILLVLWMGLLWLSLNLLSFPCEEAHPGYSCSDSILIEFFQQSVIPALIWIAFAIALWFTRKPRTEDTEDNIFD